MPFTLPRFTGSNSTRIWEHLNSITEQTETALNTVGDDSGWVTVAAATGWTVINPLQVRRIGAAVYLRGDITRDAGGILDGTVVDIGVLPAQYRPSSFLTLPLGFMSTGSDYAVQSLRVGISGTLQVGRAGGPAGKATHPRFFPYANWCVS